jgi:hypothetical protein
MERYIISRVADCGSDYSGRTNRIGHHWIVEETDVPLLPGGPVAIASQRNLFRTTWNEASQTLSPSGKLQNPAVSAGVCHLWQQQFSDAGWGGVAAQRIETGDSIVIIFEPGTSEEMLALLSEAFALLPSAIRWKATFSTYYMKSQEPPGTPNIQIKCFPLGSESIGFARRMTPNTFLIDLTKKEVDGKPAQDQTPSGKYVEEARTGIISVSVSMPMAKTKRTESDHAQIPGTVAVPMGYEGGAIENKELYPSAVPGFRPQPTLPIPHRRKNASRLMLLIIGLLFFAIIVVGTWGGWSSWNKDREIVRLHQEIALLQQQIHEADT